MSGAFIVSREIFENPIWLNNVEFRMFFLILGKAVFSEEGQYKGNVHIKKGQWLRSYRNLQSDLEYLENNAIKRPGLATVKRVVEKLVSDGRINVEKTELGTLFTVVNYCKYQDFDTYKKLTRNSAKNSNGTAAEQRRNNNNNADNSENENKEDIPYEYIVAYLNNQAGTQYKHTSKTTREHIRARWKEGFRQPDFYAVIDKKCNEWLSKRR